MCDMPHLCVTRLIHMSDRPHLYARSVSTLQKSKNYKITLACIIHISDMSHLHMWCDIPHLHIHICDIPHLHIHICDIPHLHIHIM